MKAGDSAALALRGLDALGIKAGALVLPATLGAVSTLLRVAALSSFLPLVYSLFAPESGRLGRLKFIADYLPVDSYPLPVILTGFILGLAVVSALADYLSDYLEAKLQRSAEIPLNSEVFLRYLSFGQSYHDRIHLSRSAVQLRKIPQRATRLIAFLGKGIKSVQSFLIYGIAMLFLSWQLAAVVFACLCFYFLVFGRLSSRLEEVEAQLDSLVDEANAEAQEILANATLIRHSHSQAYEASRWQKFILAISNVGERRQQIVGLNDPVVNFLGVMLLLIVVHGASGFIGEVQTYESVRYLLFFLFFRRAITEFNRFLRLPGDWKNIQRDLNRYFSVLDDADKGMIEGGELEFAGVTGDIRVRDLDFSYSGEKVALRNVNLMIPRDRITAIVGPSGSGKSTFLKLLLRDYEYQSGQILIDDNDIRRYTTASLLRHSAFLGREAQLFSNTIEFNLKYGRSGVDDEEITQVLQDALCENIVEKLPLGLQTDMGDHGNLFSSGERQRIALARLMLRREASLFLLDEATSALDGVSENAVIDSLSAIPGATIVLVTHRLSAVKRDMHVLLFEEGTVVEQGRCGELLSEGGRFRALWDKQNLAVPD